MSRQFFVGGNFKMNGDESTISSIVKTLSDSVTKLDSRTEVVVAPSPLFLLQVRDSVPKGVGVAAQNVFDKPNGAWTGEVSAQQLKAARIDWTLTGHSERRHTPTIKESEEFVANKTKFAVDNGLSVIFCVGETLEEREAGRAMDVIVAQTKPLADKLSKEQWSKIVVAYEPVWAIGTGKTATPKDAQDIHKATREWLSKNVGADIAEATRIIYGGSVSEKNCKALGEEADIDGFLVGGASLKPAFIDIINAKL